MTTYRNFVGLDVHARTIVGCVIDVDTGEVAHRRFGYDLAEVLAWIRALPGLSIAVYEAGPTGFGLYRLLTGAGIDCVVAAPSDLGTWLGLVSVAMRGPYGEVMRTSTAISATEPALGARLADAFGRPALADIRARLDEAVRAGHISETADLDATIDLLFAIIVYVGMSRQDVERIPAVIAVLRSGIES